MKTNKLFLLREMIRLRGSQCISIQGSSMVPTLYPGMKVVVRECGECIEVGEIVLFSTHSQEFVVHRVYKRVFKDGKFWFVTKGDSVFTPDPEISEEEVLGKIVAVKCDGGIKKINGLLSRCLWKTIMSLQVAIGKKKSLVPEGVQRVLRNLLLGLLGCTDKRNLNRSSSCCEK